MNKQINEDKDILQSKTSPVSLLDEINKLYRELFELDLESSKISREDLMEPASQIEAADFDSPDSKIRREEIMSLIMQLTQEYTQIIMHKP